MRNGAEPSYSRHRTYRTGRKKAPAGCHYRRFKYTSIYVPIYIRWIFPGKTVYQNMSTPATPRVFKKTALNASLPTVIATVESLQGGPGWEDSVTGRQFRSSVTAVKSKIHLRSGKYVQSEPHRMKNNHRRRKRLMMEAESIGVMDQPVSLLAVYFHLSASADACGNSRCWKRRTTFSSPC